MKSKNDKKKTVEAIGEAAPSTETKAPAETWVKAYKGFNADMTCLGFQYEEGKEYETERAKCCEAGFHACKHPLDCFGYYAPADSVFHEVEQGGQMDCANEDTKVASTKIRIGARLDVPMLCKLAFEFVRSRCTNKYNADNGKAATAGEYGAATAGASGAATAGASGAATAGEYGAATAGASGAATAGFRGAATAGEYGAATAGEYGAATAKGSVKVGKNGIGCVRGNNVKAMGGMGAILVIAEENENNYDIANHATIVIDGKKYNPDTWYCMKDGKIEKAEE